MKKSFGNGIRHLAGARTSQRFAVRQVDRGLPRERARTLLRTVTLAVEPVPAALFAVAVIVVRPPAPRARLGDDGRQPGLEVGRVKRRGRAGGVAHEPARDLGPLVVPGVAGDEPHPQ